MHFGVIKEYESGYIELLGHTWQPPGAIAEMPQLCSLTLNFASLQNVVHTGFLFYDLLAGHAMFIYSLVFSAKKQLVLLYLPLQRPNCLALCRSEVGGNLLCVCAL